MTKPKPKFCLSKAKNAKFETFYHDYFEIRDLGLSEATHGVYDGFVTRRRNWVVKVVVIITSTTFKLCLS